MSRLLLIDPDEASRAVAALLRHGGHEVIETDEDNALLLYREGVDAVFVWPGQGSARAATLLQKLAEGGQSGGSSVVGGEDASRTPSLPGPELVGQRPRGSGIDYELPRDGIDFAEFERAVLVQALSIAGGNQTRAASLLGLTRDQIRYRMSKFGLARPTATGE